MYLSLGIRRISLRCRCRGSSRGPWTFDSFISRDFHGYVQVTIRDRKSVWDSRNGLFVALESRCCVHCSVLGFSGWTTLLELWSCESPTDLGLRIESTSSAVGECHAPSRPSAGSITSYTHPSSDIVAYHAPGRRWFCQSVAAHGVLRHTGRDDTVYWGARNRIKHVLAKYSKHILLCHLTISIERIVKTWQRDSSLRFVSSSRCTCFRYIYIYIYIYIHAKRDQTIVFCIYRAILSQWRPVAWDSVTHKFKWFRYCTKNE